MSYHLRALAKWGFVERAANSADGRERPWRAIGARWRIDAMPDQLAATATNAVVNAMLDRLRADVAVWFSRERDQPKEWRAVAAGENSNLWLTAEEATELRSSTAASSTGTAAAPPTTTPKVRAACAPPASSFPFNSTD